MMQYNPKSESYRAFRALYGPNKTYDLPCGRAIKFVRHGDGTGDCLVQRWLLPTSPGLHYLAWVIRTSWYGSRSQA